MANKKLSDAFNRATAERQAEYQRQKVADSASTPPSTGNRVNDAINRAVSQRTQTYQQGGSGDPLMDLARQRARDESKVGLWKDNNIRTNDERDSLVKELRRIQNSNAMPAVRRRDEIRKRLAEIDNELGNGEMSYGSDRVAGTVTGAAKGWAGDQATFLGKFGEGIVRLGGETYGYSGWDPTYLPQGEIGQRDEEWYDQQVKDLQPLQDFGRNMGEGGERDIQMAKNGLGKVGQLGVDLGANAVQMGLDRATGPLAMASLFTRASGGGMRQAEAEGANLKQQLLYGTAAGTVEAATEMLTGGLAKFYGKGTADALIEGAVRKMVKSDAGRKALLVLADMAGEGIEEIISDIANPYIKAFYDNGEALRTKFGSKEGFMDALSEELYDGLVGALMGGFGAVTKGVSGDYKQTTQKMQYADQAETTLNEAWNHKENAREFADLIARRASGEELSPQERKRLESRPTAMETLDKVQNKMVDDYRASPEGKAAMKETSDKGIDQFFANEQVTEDEKKILKDGYETGTADPIEYAYGAKMAYDMGKSGSQYTLTDVKSQLQGSGLNDTQIAHAFELGKKAGATTADITTESGRTAVEARLAALGWQAAAAAETYQGDQDVERFSAAMVKAVQLYAANGADLQVVYNDAKAGKINDIIEGLTPAQIAKAQQLGNAIREERVTSAKQQADNFAAIRQEAQARIDAKNPKVAEINESIKAVQDYISGVQDEIDTATDILEQARKADPGVVNTEEYQAELERIEGMREQIENSKPILKELQAAREEARKESGGKRKKGSVTAGEATFEGKTYKAADMENLNRKQKTVVAMAEAVADALNLDIVLFDDAKGPFGAYTQGNTVYLNVGREYTDSKKMARSIAGATLSHELTHYIQRFAPAEYQALRDFVTTEILKTDAEGFRQLVQEQTDTDQRAHDREMARLAEERKAAVQRGDKAAAERYAEQIKKAAENYKPMTYDAAMNEVVANACQTMLEDSKTIRKLAREHMTLAEKIADAIDEIVGKVKAAFAEVDISDGGIFRAAQMMSGEFDRLQELWDAGLEAAARNAEAVNENATPEGGVQYMAIGYTTDNVPVAMIDENILEGVPEEQWVAAVKDVMKTRFSGGIPISGRLIKVNSITRREYVGAQDTMKYRATDGTVYEDKLKAAGGIDDIVLASTNYVNEDLEHERNDNFTEFARGDVLMRIGGNDYAAKVIVGFTTGKQMVLYDVVDFKPTTIKIKKQIRGTQAKGVTADTRSDGSVPTNKIAQINEAVKENNAPAVAESTTQMQEWTGEEPKNVQYGFKLMNVDENGLPHAMFIDAAKPYEFGKWYAADSPKMENLIKLEPGYAYLVDENDVADLTSRRPVRKENGSFRGLPGKTAVNKATEENKRWMVVDQYADGSKSVHNVGINGSGGVSTFALRPGLHAVDIPSMSHIGAKSKGSSSIDTRRPNQAWFLIEYPVDQDYNQEAYAHETKDIREHLPERGWYSFQTNSGAEAKQHWFITGGMRIVGMVSEADARKYARDHGFEEDLPWRQGKSYSEDTAINLDEYIRTTKAKPTPSKEEMRQRIESERAQHQTIEVGDSALEVDTDTESVNVQYSRATWEESDYVQNRDEAAAEIAKAIGISEKKAKDYIDSVNSVAKMIADERARLDYTDTGLSPFVSNAEYGGSFDFTTLCKKRRLLTGTFSAIQKALPNTALTANEILEIRKMMDDVGLEVSCGKCYVEGSRASMGTFTKQFLELYKKYNPGKWVPNMAEMNTPDGIEWVRQTHPEVYEQYEYFWNHYGTLKPGDANQFASQQKPKLYQMRTAYKGEILQHFKRDGSIAEKNRNGGVRMQSFSDFEIVHLIDAMQVIMDMSRVGLNGQAYTKVPDFAWALGRTGLKINLSIDAWSVDENSKLVFNNKEGMNFDTAMEIRNANSENVGTICCVYDDAQLLAALADDRIDFIIPFHRSQWKKSQYKAMGLPATTKDYTYQQNEKWLNQKDHMHEYRGRQVPDKCRNYMPNEYWDFTKSGKENAEEYLRMCARDGKRPKFYRFLTNNGDGSFSLKADGSTDGYWKLLIDFKMYDNEGKGVPQRPVRPDFNMEEVNRMLTSYEGGHNQFPVAQGIVDEFVEKYKARNPGQTQFQEYDYSEARESTEFRTRQQEADALLEEVKNYFTEIEEESDQWLSEEEIEDALELNPYGNPMRGYMMGAPEILQVLSERGDNYPLMERLLKMAGVTTQRLWTDGTLDRAFADWYNERHPSLYYEGYQPGDLFGNRKNMQKERDYLHELIMSGRLTIEDAEEARNLLLRMQFPNEREIFYQNWDDTYNDSASEAAGREQAYSLVEAENMIIADTLQALEKLTKDQANTIAKLEAKLKLTKNPEVREADAKRLAGELLKKSGSTMARTDVAAELKAIGDYVLNGQVNADELKARARSLAANILSQAEEVIETDNEQLSQIKSRLAGERIYLPAEFVGELQSSGGFAAIKNKLFGKRLYLSTTEGDGRMSVDRLYEELHADYGNYFFPEAGSDNGPTNAGEEILVIMNVLEASGGMTVNPFEQYMGEATEELANEIVKNAMEGVMRPALSEADKWKSVKDGLNQQIKELKKQGELSEKEAGRLWQTVYDLSVALDKANSKMQTLRAETEYRVAQTRAEGAARAAEIKAAERERAAKQIKGLKEYYADQRKRAAERREESAGVTKYRKQVQVKAQKLYELLMTNSDKKHVPEVLKRPLAEFLEELDFTSKRALAGGPETRSDDAFGAKLMRLQQLLANQQDYLNGNGEMKEDLGGYIDVSPDNLEFLRTTAELITRAMNEGRGFTVNSMTAAQLKDLSNFLSAMGAAIRNMNNFMANARYESVREAAVGDWDHMQEMGKAGAFSGTKANKFVAWENGTPYYVMKRFGAGGQSIFDGLAKGWEKMAYNAQEIIQFTENLYATKEVNDWKKTTHEIKLTDGSTVKMTTAQIMELSMLLGREQALKHIQKGGIRIGDIETGKGTVHDTTHYHLTDTDLQNILGKLDARQRKVAKLLQKFMAEKGAQWGNEVSMRRFGYNFYTEGEGYYPIRTDANDRPMADTDAQMNSMFRLLNLSSSKSLNPKASNALIVGDIFDTFSDHMADMAKLNGMGLPILDAIKWFNYKERVNHDDGTYDTKTMQAAMEQAYGTQALNYFRTMMKDINGMTESGDRGTGVFSKLMSNYKIAAVGANLRVAFLQPTSYVRALTVLKPQYLIGTLPSVAAYREALKYSGTAVWKSLGYYDTDISKSMRGQIVHDDTFRDKVAEASMFLAEKGDQLTWSMLWTACKKQAAGEGLRGDALMRKTTELFREVVYSSQVMDSTLTRSQIMRGKTLATKAASAFMAEPTLSYNILLDAVSQYQIDVRKHGKAGAWQRNGGKVGKALSVYVASAAFAALVESIADAVRDDDDEKFWEKFKQALWGEDGKWMSGNLAQDLTILGKLPYVKDFISTLQGYSSGNLSATGFNNLLNAYKIWEETVKLNAGKQDKATKITYYGRMTDWGKVYKTLQALSQMTGYAASNMTRDVVAIWNTIMNGRKDDWKIRTYDSMSESTKKAWEENVKATGIQRSQYAAILDEANADGNTSVTQAELNTYLQNETKAGNLTQEQATAIWDAQGWKKSWEEYNKPKETKSETKTTSSSGSTEKRTITTFNTWQDFHDGAHIYKSNLSDVYDNWEDTVKPRGISLDKFTKIINEADTDGNNSVKQKELVWTLWNHIESEDITYKDAEAIWYAMGWEKEFKRYIRKKVGWQIEPFINRGT